MDPGIIVERVKHITDVNLHLIPRVHMNQHMSLKRKPNNKKDIFTMVSSH